MLGAQGGRGHVSSVSVSAISWGRRRQRRPNSSGCLAWECEPLSVMGLVHSLPSLGRWGARHTPGQVAGFLALVSPRESAGPEVCTQSSSSFHVEPRSPASEPVTPLRSLRPGAPKLGCPRWASGGSMAEAASGLMCMPSEAPLLPVPALRGCAPS